MRARTSASAARRWVRLGGALVLVAALTGCVRLDMDLTVGLDDTLSGAIVIAFDDKAIGPFVDEDDLLAQVERQNPLGRTPARGTVAVEPYEADGMVGKRYRYTDVPLEDFNAAGALTLRHEDRRYVLGGALDLSSRGDSRVDLGALTDTAAASVRFSFPGRVLAANGRIDGRTVTWSPPFGERTELSAAADDGRPPPSPSAAAAPSAPGTSWLVPTLVAVGAAALVLLAVVWMWRRRARRREAFPPDPVDGGDAASTGAPPGASPPRHPTLPLPVLETPDALIRDPRWAEQSPTDPWRAGQRGSDES